MNSIIRDGEQRAFLQIKDALGHSNFTVTGVKNGAFTVMKSKNVTADALAKIIFTEKLTPHFSTTCPVINAKRDANGDLSIELKSIDCPVTCVNDGTLLQYTIRRRLDAATATLIKSLPKPFQDVIEVLLAANDAENTTLRIKEIVTQNPLLVKTSCSESATPLEVALALDSPLLATTFLKLLTEEERMQGIEILLTRYPQATSQILELFFKVDERHFSLGNLSGLSIKPQATPPTDLHFLEREFRTVLEATPDRQFTLIDSGFGSDQKTIDEVAFYIGALFTNIDLLRQVSQSPPAGTAALKDGYELITTHLSHVILHLKEAKKVDSPSVYREKVVDICCSLAYAQTQCFTQYTDTSIKLYQKYCLAIEPECDNVIYQELLALRSLVVEGMSAESYVHRAQDVHAIRHFKRVLGEMVQLFAHVDGIMEDDITLGFKDQKRPPDAVIISSFFKKYSPSGICSYIKESLRDERKRNVFIDWAKVHLKDACPARREFKAKKAELLAKKEELLALLLNSEVKEPTLKKYKAELAELKTKLDIIPAPKQSDLDALKDDMRGALLNWIFDDALIPRDWPILLTLKKLQVLTFKV